MDSLSNNDEVFGFGRAMGDKVFELYPSLFTCEPMKVDYYLVGYPMVPTGWFRFQLECVPLSVFLLPLGIGSRPRSGQRSRWTFPEYPSLGSGKRILGLHLHSLRVRRVHLRFRSLRC